MPSLGLYLHLPYCRSRCSYCAFYTLPYNAAEQAAYVEALCLEIQQVALHGRRAGEQQLLPQAGRVIDTVFLGGGTPSLLGQDQLAMVMATLRAHFAMDRCREITLEANPETVTTVAAAGWMRAGITRLSLGAQSFQDGVLRRLGRRHGAARTAEAVAQARSAGLQEISLDIIAGVQGGALLDDLDQALALRPQHLSMYLLEVDEEETGAVTALALQVARGKARVPDQDWFADAYPRAVRRLAAANLRRYEISNFARPGHASRHNLRYWRQREVLGFGVASHSLVAGVRHAVVADSRDYLAAGGCPQVVFEPAGLQERVAEAWIMGLRLAGGVSAREVAVRCGCAQVEIPMGALQGVMEGGLLTRRGDRLRLTQRGILLSNEVFQAFLP